MDAPVQPPIPAQPAQKNNSLALTAGILGIASIVVSALGFLVNFVLPGVGLCGCGLGLLAAIAGLVLGFIGQSQLKSRPAEKGKGWAITGIVIGIVSILSICVFIVLAVVFGATFLTMFGPVIGNVFSEINNSLITP